MHIKIRSDDFQSWTQNLQYRYMFDFLAAYTINQEKGLTKILEDTVYKSRECNIAGRAP